jgi:hypothetical protein
VQELDNLHCSSSVIGMIKPSSMRLAEHAAHMTVTGMRRNFSDGMRRLGRPRRNSADPEIGIG